MKEKLWQVFYFYNKGWVVWVIDDDPKTKEECGCYYVFMDYFRTKVYAIDENNAIREGIKKLENYEKYLGVRVLSGNVGIVKKIVEYEPI